MIVFLSVLLAILSWTVVSGYADEPDYRYRRVIVYELHKADSVWAARSTETITQVYRSRRSLREGRFWEYGSYFNPIVSLEAELSGDEIDEELITTVTPSYQDTFLNDDKAVSITLPREPIVGDSLRYVVEREWTDATYLPVHRVPNYNVTSSYTIVVEHPSSIRVDFNVVSARSAVQGIVDRSTPDRTRITFVGLPYQPSLVAYPFDHAHAYVTIEITEGGRHVTKNHPSDFGAWYRGLFDQKCDLSDRDRQRVLASVAPTRRAIDTVRAVYDYVRSNIRYVSDERGVNSYVPRMPSTVVKQGYGDCKDRAHFVSSFLRLLGYDAGMVLIHTEPRPIIRSTVHMSMFNHVIAYAVVEGDTIFMDPTAQFMPFGNLPEVDVDRDVFLVHAMPARWTRTHRPTQPPTLRIDATVDLATKTATSCSVVLRADMASRVRYSQGLAQPKELSSLISSLVADELSKVRVVDPEVEHVSDSLVMVKTTLDLRSYFVSGTERTYCPLVPSAIVSGDILGRESDTLPIIFESRPDVEMRLRFVGGAQLTDTNVVVKGPAGTVFSMEVTSGRSTTPEIRYRWTLGTKMFEGAQRDQLLAWARTIARTRKSMLTIR